MFAASSAALPKGASPDVSVVTGKSTNPRNP